MGRGWWARLGNGGIGCKSPSKSAPTCGSPGAGLPAPEPDPDNGRQVVEAAVSATLLDRVMERDNGIPALVLTPGEAHVADHHNESSPRHQAAKALSPDGVQFAEELGVVRFVAKLALSLRK